MFFDSSSAADEDAVQDSEHDAQDAENKKEEDRLKEAMERAKKHESGHHDARTRKPVKPANSDSAQTAKDQSSPSSSASEKPLAPTFSVSQGPKSSDTGPFQVVQGAGDDSGESVAQLQQTKRELEKRLRELETFQRITVDRELKMIELKKEVLRLRKALKRAKTTK